MFTTTINSSFSSGNNVKLIVCGMVVCRPPPLAEILCFEASHSIYSDGVRFSKLFVSRCFYASPLTPLATIDRNLYRGVVYEAAWQLTRMSEKCKKKQKLFYISVHKYTFI